MALITLVPEFTCACGNVLNATTSPTDEGETPEPGDLTICVCCERVYRFTDSMGLTEITREQVLSELTSGEVDALLRSFQKLDAMKGRTPSSVGDAAQYALGKKS